MSKKATKAIGAITKEVVSLAKVFVSACSNAQQSLITSIKASYAAVVLAIYDGNDKALKIKACRAANKVIREVAGEQYSSGTLRTYCSEARAACGYPKEPAMSHSGRRGGKGGTGRTVAVVAEEGSKDNPPVVGNELVLLEKVLHSALVMFKTSEVIDVLDRVFAEKFKKHVRISG